MTFAEFQAKWTGQPVDFDGVYPNQCMDLMHQYIYEVLGITDAKVLAAPAAYQAYTNNFPQYFTKIDNTPDNIPQNGDIIFFGTLIGAYGHVCIFVDGDTNRFNSFDANWPTGSLPHIQNHSYNGVLGWLRFKQPEPPKPEPLTGLDLEVGYKPNVVNQDVMVNGVHYKSVDGKTWEIVPTPPSVPQNPPSVTTASTVPIVVPVQTASTTSSTPSVTGSTTSVPTPTTPPIVIPPKLSWLDRLINFLKLWMKNKHK
jgi:hypothetical protein